MTRLLAGTTDGLHILGGEQAARGARRSRPLPQGPIHFPGHRVTALAVRGRNWWAILDARSIQRSRMGQRWEEVAVLDELRALCLLPMASGLLIGTSDAHLLRLRGRKLERIESFERTKGRESWYTPWGGPPDTRSLALGGQTIFANIHVGGVTRSRDGGRSWAPTIDIDSDVHEVIVHPTRPRTVLAATAVGLAVSRDGGTSWDMKTEGLHATYQRAVAAAGNLVLVSSSRSERGQQAAVYRWELGSDGPLERCRAGLPDWFSDNVNTGCLAAQRGRLVIGAPEGAVYTSTDRGRSWQHERDGLPRVTCVAIV